MSLGAKPQMRERTLRYTYIGEKKDKKQVSFIINCFLFEKGVCWGSRPKKNTLLSEMSVKFFGGGKRLGFVCKKKIKFLRIIAPPPVPPRP